MESNQTLISIKIVASSVPAVLSLDNDTIMVIPTWWYLMQ